MHSIKPGHWLVQGWQFLIILHLVVEYIHKLEATVQFCNTCKHVKAYLSNMYCTYALNCCKVSQRLPGLNIKYCGCFPQFDNQHCCDVCVCVCATYWPLQTLVSHVAFLGFCVCSWTTNLSNTVRFRAMRVSCLRATSSKSRSGMAGKLICGLCVCPYLD